MSKYGRRAWHLAIGPFFDAVLFLLLIHGGWHYGLAHILSFAAGAVLTALIVLFLSPADRGDRAAGSHGILLLAHLLAIPLRGGVLALWIGAWGMAAPWAIVGTVLVSSMVTLCGKELSRTTFTSSGDRWQAVALALALYALILRIVFMASLQLLPEEAYYWNYSQHLALGYLDHPPMVAWLIRCGTALFGNAEFGVRSGALLCGGLASLFIYHLTRELFGGRSAWIAVAIMQLMPAAFLSGFLMTPDAPLMACWAAALYFLQRALLRGDAKSWWAAGLALGAGLVSKYTIGLLVPATFLFLVIDGPSRRWLKNPATYGAAALAILVFSPVILWNAQHGWASFAFQTTRRLAESPHFSFHLLIASILVLITPAMFMALPFVLGKSAATPPFESRRALFVRVFTLVPLAVFVLFSLSHPVKFDWTCALWLAVVPAIAHAIEAPDSARIPLWLRAWWLPTAAVVLMLFGSVLHYLTAGPPGLPYGKDMQQLPVVWRELGRQVAAEARQMPEAQAQAPLVVGMNAYMLASELAFYAPDPRRAAQNTASQHLFGTSGLMYELWFPNQAQNGRTLLLVTLHEKDLEATRLAPYAGSLGPLESGVLHHNGREIGRYFYRRVQDYHNMGLDPSQPPY